MPANRRTRKRNLPYYVEAWRRLECIGFRHVQRTSTVASAAYTYILDRSADRVIVRKDGLEGMAAEWNATGGWRINDADLVPVLVTFDFEGE